jgi:hypothetical protein
MERSIFGDISGQRGSLLPSLAGSGNSAAADLEKSARRLLEQVQNAAADAAPEQPWIRRPAARDAAAGTSRASTAAPPRTQSAAKPGSETGAADTPMTAPADEEPGMSFDPFLEAESEGSR